MITVWKRRFGAWLERLDAMRRLEMLDDRLLADMGVPREDIADLVSGEAPCKPGQRMQSQSRKRRLAAPRRGWHGLETDLSV